MKGFNGEPKITDKSFLKKLDRLYPLICSTNLRKYAQLFKQELIKALSNQPSNLPTILNPIAKTYPEPGFGIAVSIGGTYGYASAFKITNKRVIKFINRYPFELPRRTTKNKLFHLITQKVLAVSQPKKKIFPIGIGLAYPLKPTLANGHIDGELLTMTKGRTIAGLVGKKVGQEYHKFLIKNYHIDATVTVANDSICLLLGGSGVDIAGVVGTGLNFAYWEQRSKIAPIKLGELNEFVQREVAINCESKGFDKIEKTPLVKIVDQQSDNCGFDLAEKEVAGAYLYKIFNAGKDKLLGKNFPLLSSTDCLNDIVSGAFEYPKKATSDAKGKAQFFAERILHRSAQIVAIELSGILLKINKIKGIIPVVMDGGLFWKALNYPSLVNLYVNQILPQATPSFTRIFGSSRRGIAILAMNGK